MRRFGPRVPVHREYGHLVGLCSYHLSGNDCANGTSLQRRVARIRVVASRFWFCMESFSPEQNLPVGAMGFPASRYCARDLLANPRIHLPDCFRAWAVAMSSTHTAASYVLVSLCAQTLVRVVANSPSLTRSAIYEIPSSAPCPS